MEECMEREPERKRKQGGKERKEGEDRLYGTASVCIRTLLLILDCS